jgi:hypothetical protein
MWMTQLASEMPAGYKTMLFAFDRFRDAQGVADSKSSIFHVPNVYEQKSPINIHNTLSGSLRLAPIIQMQ